MLTSSSKSIIAATSLAFASLSTPKLEAIDLNSPMGVAMADQILNSSNSQGAENLAPERDIVAGAQHSNPQELLEQISQLRESGYDGAFLTLMESAVGVALKNESSPISALESIEAQLLTFSDQASILDSTRNNILKVKAGYLNQHSDLRLAAIENCNDLLVKTTSLRTILSESGKLQKEDEAKLNSIIKNTPLDYQRQIYRDSTPAYLILVGLVIGLYAFEFRKTRADSK